MEIVLTAVGVAVASFFVWLIVRIVNRPERWAKRLAVWFVVLLVAYPLSLWPVWRLWAITGRSLVLALALDQFYGPLWIVARYVCSKPIREWLFYYCVCGAYPGEQ